MVAAAFLTFTSCSNDQPSFNDADAFVAMLSSTVNTDETSGSIEIPVMLTSLAGIETTVDFEISAPETAGAVEGEHFTLANSSKTLTFTKDAPTQNIKVNILDNDEFGGNVKFVITLVNPKNVNLGANTTCTVTIEDNEHPLSMILGDYTISDDDLVYGDHYDWTITVSRDENDLSKVWFSNLDPYFAANGLVAPKYNYVYGIVNDDKTEIRIPVGQDMGYTSSSGATSSLEGFADPTGEVPLEAGDNILVQILDGGDKLYIENVWITKVGSSYWEGFSQSTFTKVK